MIITIKTIQNKRFIVYNLEISPSDTVKAIKQKIHKNLSLYIGEPASQKLVHHGKILQDDQTAASAGFKDKDSLFVFVRKIPTPTPTESPTSHNTSSTQKLQLLVPSPDNCNVAKVGVMFNYNDTVETLRKKIAEQYNMPYVIFKWSAYLLPYELQSNFDKGQREMKTLKECNLHNLQSINVKFRHMSCGVFVRIDESEYIDEFFIKAKDWGYHRRNQTIKELKQEIAIKYLNKTNCGYFCEKYDMFINVGDDKHGDVILCDDCRWIDEDSYWSEDAAYVTFDIKTKDGKIWWREANTKLIVFGYIRMLTEKILDVEVPFSIKNLCKTYYQSQ